MVTPIQEEQDEDDDRLFDNEAPASPLWFTAKQKGKGKASTGPHPLNHHFEYHAEDDAGRTLDQNISEQQFKSGPV